MDDDALAKLAAELKKKCGCGGAVKDGVIEIQGDKRDLLKSLLEAKGMKVKLAGGYSIIRPRYKYRGLDLCWCTGQQI
jgi:translation initiation factor 1